MRPRKLRIKSARDLGPQFVDNGHRMIGQDGAYSIPLNGESLWFFGDTLIGERAPNERLWYVGGQPVGPQHISAKGPIKRMINNTGLILRDKTGKYGLKNFSYICDETGNIKQLVPSLPDEPPDDVRVWCLHGCAIQNKVYLFFIEVRMHDEGLFPLNFKIIGSGLAVGSSYDWDFHRIRYKRSTIIWKKSEPHFGSAVLRGLEEDRVFIYGVLRDEEKIQKCYLARVKSQDMEQLEKYEYLASPDSHWSPQVKDAISVFTGMPNELSVSYNAYLEGYLAVHSLDTSGHIVGRTAPDPWGPWSEPTILWTVKPNYQKPLPYPPLIYAGKEHPELAEENGRVIYITYVEFEEYFPHLIEIILG